MKNDILRCNCIDMSVDGMGIARSDDLVVFVKGMICGETADVRIIDEKKNYSVGIIDKMIQPSPYRIDPKCPIAHKCGGCDYRHIEYDYQLQIKKQLLINTLKNNQIEDVLGCDNPDNYRNKVQVPVREGKVGFYRRHSNDIMEFDECLIESELANSIINDLKPQVKNLRQLRHIIIKHAYGTDQVMLCFVLNNFDIDLNETIEYITKKYSQIKTVILNLNDKDTNVVIGSKEKVVYGEGFIYDIYDGIKVKISLKSFYQVNYSQMLKLYDLIRKLADVDNKTRVLDLYCGIGTISLYLARYAKSVTGVEIVAEAIENANDNVRINKIGNADFILADATKNMDKYISQNDVISVDPPRKGLSKQLVESLINNKPSKIVYVSCNPATLARDLDLLRDYYDIGTIHPVDMFPHTVHIESVCLLVLKDSNI